MERTCSQCHGSMFSRRADARFCSTKCRVANHRRPKFPEAMVSRDRWLRRDADKRPLTITGKAGSSTNKHTWSSFADASKSPAGIGLGYVLGDGIGAYDYDHAFIDGELADWAREHIESIPEPVLFMEVSQSGEGVHVFIEAPESKGSKIRDGRNIERYTVGRYMAVTGIPFKL